MDINNAFVLWRGLGIDYQGGVLDNPARVAIHFVHRLGAMVTALTLGLTSLLAWRCSTRVVKLAGLMIGVMLLTQLILGLLWC